MNDNFSYGWIVPEHTPQWADDFHFSMAWFGPDDWDVQGTGFAVTERIEVPRGATCDICGEQIEASSCGVAITLDNPTWLIRRWPVHIACAEQERARELAAEPTWITPSLRPTRAIVTHGPYDGQEGLILHTTMMPRGGIEYLVQLDSGIQERFVFEQVRLIAIEVEEPSEDSLE